MPFMKPNQPWLYDDITGDMIGVKDPDGGERFFDAQRYSIGAIGALPPAGTSIVAGGRLCMSSGNRLGMVELQPRRGTTPLRLMASLGAAGTGTLTAALGGYRTCDQQIPAPGAFKGVRLVYANYDTAATMPIAKAKVASAAKHLTATGSQMTWQDITFNGALSASVPAATPGAAQQAPGLLVSDMIPLQAIPRTDGGSRGLIRVRTLIDGVSVAKTVTVLTVSGTQSAAFNAASWNNGYQFGSYSPAVDAVTNPADSNSLTETGGPIMCIGAVFVTDDQIDTIACFGDSLVAGATTTNNTAGWPTRLTMLDAGLSGINFGSSGQKTKDTLGTFRSYLAGMPKPMYAAFRMWSPNDGYTSQQAFDDAWAYGMEMLELCRNNDIIPVVLTSGPVNGYNASQNTFRLNQNAKTLELRKYGVIVVDAASVVTQPGTDNTINPLFDGGDNLHYNDLGHEAIARKVLQEIAIG